MQFTLNRTLSGGYRPPKGGTSSRKPHLESIHLIRRWKGPCEERQAVFEAVEWPSLTVQNRKTETRHFPRIGEKRVSRNYLTVTTPVIGNMPDYLSDSELERMEEFASTPKYKRKPDLLIPSDGE